MEEERYQPVDPEEMTSEERLNRIVELLARAVVNLTEGEK